MKRGVVVVQGAPVLRVEARVPVTVALDGNYFTFDPQRERVSHAWGMSWVLPTEEAGWFGAEYGIRFSS